MAWFRRFDDAPTGRGATGEGGSCYLAFCTIVHSFPQRSFSISLANKKHRVYRLEQIEPRGLKNLTAQLKEGAIA